MNLSSNLVRWGRDGIVLLLLVAGAAWLQTTQLREILDPGQASLQLKAESQERTEQLKLTIFQKMPGLGFDNLISDWTFLNFLQYFGNKELREITGYGLSAEYFEVIVERDPLFYLPYIFLSSSVSIFAGEPERAIALQEKGLQSMSPTLPPESYFVWRHKGIDELLFLGDAEAARRSHEIAAEWAAQSPDPRAEEDQYSLRQTAQFLAQDPNSTRAQINAWTQVLSSAPDDETRAIATQRIKELGGEVVKTEEGRYVIRYNKAEP